jgi:hypothetical protein
LALKSSFSQFPGLQPGLGKNKAFGPKNPLLRNFKIATLGSSLQAICFFIVDKTLGCWIKLERSLQYPGKCRYMTCDMGTTHDGGIRCRWLKCLVAIVVSRNIKARVIAGNK